MGSGDEPFTVAPPNEGVVSLAQARRRLYKRVEHGLHVERRTADYLEHVGGGCLLLEGFAQLVEQPRVLDGNDGLRGKIANQLNLLVDKRAYFLTIDGNGPDDLVRLEHRYRHDGANARD